MKKKSPGFKTLELAGHRSGMLVGDSFVGKDRFGGNLWLCHCDCGGSRIVSAAKLNNQSITQCGCVTGVVSNLQPVSDIPSTKAQQVIDHFLYRYQGEQHEPS